MTTARTTTRTAANRTTTHSSEENREMTAFAAPVAPWTGTVQVEDTTLHVSDTGDTGGAGRPVVYLNGCYADTKHWRRVVAELGDGYRHITFDARARGRSGRSADYSFDACVRDVSAVLAARGVTGADRPVLVGWSYGAAIGITWADRNPGLAAGVVSVDGALPNDWLDEAGRAQIRRLFKRLGPLFPIARRLGLAAKMSAVQHAEVNIEANEVCATGVLLPVLERIQTPVRYVLASGGNLGGAAEVMEGIRADFRVLSEACPAVEISAKVASNHSKILSRDFRAVADAVRELAG
ncbi:alpha/beta fold hydrolase [Kitasatospora sp. NPDC096147]|uniref:alpha/beta fold hydrolase n=1 Tax=Kitasatospora sp. NPDC096147 TaxID=3364093 RepID=UPI003811BA70